MSLFGRNSRDEGSPAEEARAPSAPGPANHGSVTERTERARPAGARGEKGMAHIGKSITIKGDLSGDEDLVIEGDVEGRVELPNNQVTIGADGRVKADVYAQAVVVVGHITGNVSGVERVEVQASGVVDGDVKAPRLSVQEGAQLNGTVDMSAGKAAERPAASPGKSAPATAPGGASEGPAAKPDSAQGQVAVRGT